MARQFGLIGYPLGHSFSKELHERLFALSGDSYAAYHMLELPPNRLEQDWAELSRLDGFNVTLPHKLLVYRKMQRHALSARQCGSVNTVKREPDGSLTGYNTDVVGFLRTMELLPHTLRERVLLLGCGGAAHMMAAQTVAQGGSLTVAVRPTALERAETMANSLRLLSPDCRVRVTRIDRIPREPFDVLLQATPCGMYPNIDQTPIPESVLEQAGCLFDAIYRPSETLLMRMARKMGIPTAGGMPMLIYQAVAAHKIWDNARYSNETVTVLLNDFTGKDGVQTR